MALLAYTFPNLHKFSVAVIITGVVNTVVVFIIVEGK